MNIFMIDADPAEAAVAHTDKHVRKMIIEYAQMLSGAHHHHGSSFSYSLYKPTHMNTRYMIWPRINSANYLWLRDLWFAVMDEYAYRFSDYHRTMRLTNLLRNQPRKISSDSCRTTLPHPDKMDQSWDVPDDTVATYRNIYRFGKSHLHAWTNRNQPEWL